MLKDWTTEELKTITAELKRIPAEDRPEIRNKIKELSADDALEVLKIALSEPLEAGNKPVKCHKGKNIPLTADNSEIKPKSEANDTLERVTGEEVQISNFCLSEIKSTISETINSFCLSAEIDNTEGLRKADQPIWQACCQYVGDHIFKGTDILKDKTLHDNGSAALTNDNRYDPEKIAAILSVFDFLCNKYNKVFTAWGAAAFCGINWKYFERHAEELTLLGWDVKEKREMSLSDSIVSGKRNPTGALAQLNHFHGWSTANTTRTETKETTILYPVLVQAGSKTVAIGNEQTADVL